jgi:catechol 2,3-dioxygenase-like lactoylglutathione lyase family enzyme
MIAPKANEPVRFHVSLNVADMARSTDFYRKFLDRKPTKQTTDYAKFEMDEPPLVLSLLSVHHAPGGSLNHIGIRLSSFEVLVKMQTRLETAGIATQREDGVECCHSRQTKFWVSDPDRTLWELYILHEDEDENKDRAPSHPVIETPANAVARIVWQHQIPAEFPARIPHDDNSVHEVVLEGTGNAKSESISMEAVFAETYRVLRPGGEVRLHGLVGDKPSKPVLPPLPGPAAVVEYVPVENEPMKAMIRAGFVQIRFEKLSSAPDFIADNVRMREILLVGLKPGHRPQRATHQAIYLGPLARVADDFGNVFPRGEHVSLNIHDWQLLSRSTVADQFLFLSPDTGADRTSQPLTRFSSSPASTS